MQIIYNNIMLPLHDKREEFAHKPPNILCQKTRCVVVVVVGSNPSVWFLFVCLLRQMNWRLESRLAHTHTKRTELFYARLHRRPMRAVSMVKENRREFFAVLLCSIASLVVILVAIQCFQRHEHHTDITALIGNALRSEMNVKSHHSHTRTHTQLHHSFVFLCCCF